MNNRNHLRGFTLLELLIALAVFSVLATLAYGGLKLMLDGGQQIENATDRLSSMQRVFLYMQQDLEQAVSRGVRDELGSREEALQGGGDKLLLLTTAGANGAVTRDSDLRRIEYHLNNGKLERLVWSVLDRAQESASSHLLLMNDVQSVELRFLGREESGDWNNAWPPEAASDPNELPKAVEITITTAAMGKITRLFVVTP